MQWECNAWAYNDNFTNPDPKISRKTQKPQKFWKTPKPRSKMHECFKREKIRTLTKCFDLDLGRRTQGKKFLREWEVFGTREKGFCQEREEKMKFDFALSP